MTSPRFSGGLNKIDMLIENPPSKMPNGPQYQHNSVSALGALAIDKSGGVLQKDTIVFADNKENYIYALTKEGVLNQIIDLGDNSKVDKIRCSNENIYVLDSKQGTLLVLHGKIINNIFNLPKLVQIFTLAFLLVIIVVIIFKINDRKYRSR